MNSALCVQNVSKRFRHVDQNRPRTLQETLLRGWRALRARKTFLALYDVSLTLNGGRMLGIIGANGAGKSTLLRLIGGIGKPDTGSIQTNGRIHAIFDLGASFHPDLTGRENVYVAGVIAGLTRREIHHHFDAIVDFAELAEFIDSPLRTYSAGMTVRLAFAIAVHTEPDILLIDEVLAVGDRAFQRKCLDRIQQFKRNGCAIVLVSHDMATVQSMCDEAIWLRQGQIVAQGPADAVVQQYTTRMDTLTKLQTPAPETTNATHATTSLELHRNRFGSQEMTITAVELLDSAGQAVSEIESGDAVTVRITYTRRHATASLIVGVTIARSDQYICYETHSQPPDQNQQASTVTLHLARLDLSPGLYYFDVGLYESNWEYAYDYHWHAYPLTVRSATTDTKGILHPPHQWTA